MRHLVPALLASVFAVSTTATAMDIRQFDRMTAANQQMYVDGLIQAAEDALTVTGYSDDAAKVSRLFTTGASGETSVGVIEFQRNLARARLADVERAKKGPNARGLEIEDAFYLTLEKNGIRVSTGLKNIVKEFEQSPPVQDPGRR